MTKISNVSGRLASKCREDSYDTFSVKMLGKPSKVCFQTQVTVPLCERMLPISLSEIYGEASGMVLSKALLLTGVKAMPGSSSGSSGNLMSSSLTMSTMDGFQKIIFHLRLPGKAASGMSCWIQISPFNFRWKYCMISLWSMVWIASNFAAFAARSDADNFAFSLF